MEEWRFGRAGVRRLGGYFRRAAARRAIHRMLYWARRKVRKIMAMMTIGGVDMLAHGAREKLTKG